jgi:hypothetical protein
MANKKTWDKAVAASVTFNAAVDQTMWHKYSKHVPGATGQGYEPRHYNPSGPHYNEPLVSAWPPPPSDAPPPPEPELQGE